MCAIVGVFNHPQASVLSYYALHALQHRGQEASGIVTMYEQEETGKPRFGAHKAEGLVLDVFGAHDVFTKTLKDTRRSVITDTLPRAATPSQTFNRFSSTILTVYSH